MDKIVPYKYTWWEVHRCEYCQHKFFHCSMACLDKVDTWQRIPCIIIND